MTERHFPHGQSELAGRIRAFDWASTKLGPIELWPQVLRTTTDLLLQSPVPIVALWGADGVMIYNDAYAAFAGARHPGQLGLRVADGWPEVADFNANVMRVGLAGQTLSYKDQELTLYRSGVAEQVWMNLDYSPVLDEAGRPAGVIAIVIETTERVRAERARGEADALRRLERDRAQDVLENMGEAFVLIDRAFEVVNINTHALRAARLTRAQVIGRHYRRVWPETEHNGVGAFCDAVMRSREAGSLEHAFTRANGGQAWLYLHAYPTPDGLAVFYRDITHRKRAADNLARSEQRLRELNADLERQVVERSRQRALLWQVSPDLLSIIGPDGRFTATNPAWQRVLGWPAERLDGEPFKNFLHVEDVDRSMACFADLTRGEPVLGFENRYRARDGSLRWLSWVAVPDGDEFYCSARDVTAERARDAELARATAERERVWRASLDLLVVLGFDGVFQRVNPAWTTLLGFAEHELVGTRMSELIHPEDILLTEAALSQASVGPLRRVENRYRHKDGTYRWITWAAAPEAHAIYATGRDITVEKAQAAELTAAQEALRQSQKTEAVGQLTGGIAHDFNNLLAGISGSLEVAEARLVQNRPAETHRYIGVAQGAARRAAALTQRLLAFSRRQTLDPRPTDVNRLVAGMEELIRRAIGPGMELEIIGAGGLWPTRVDPSQLENALLNLAINARDAMPDGGRITIETANKWLDERAARQRDVPPGQYISICVTDTGTGMTPDVASRAFDPFFTTKPLGQGTGLGLSMIHGFVRQSGGQVRIYSEPGHGTTMCLYLPRSDTDAEDSVGEKLSRTEDGAPSETVLVIDDEPTVRMLIVEVLEEAGYRALEAGDGPAGMKILQSDARIDLLITDVGLPGGMNGRQVADAARVGRPGLKVLFVTGYAENAVVGNGHLDAGMAVITKPFAMAALEQKIRDIIAG